MKFYFENQTESIVTLFRRAGYIFQRQERNEFSFIRPLGRASYPRFHCYVRPLEKGYHGNFHLDHKQETYGKTTRHHGEYEGSKQLQEELKHLEKSFGILFFDQTKAERSNNMGK